MSTRIYLLRHGATDIMTTHLAGRSPDIPLNRCGRKQAEALARRLPRMHAVYTSPIQRAMETAAAVALQQQLDPVILESFTEFDVGEWTGMAFQDVQNDARWHEFNRLRDLARAPGGESMTEVQHRALEGVRQLVRKQAGRSIAVVSHGDVIRALLLYAAGTAIRNYWRFEVHAASITELAWGPEGDERIVRVNDCAHLESLTP